MSKNPYSGVWEKLYIMPYNGFTISATLGVSGFISKEAWSNSSKSITRKNPLPAPNLSATVQNHKVDFLTNTIEMELLIENRGKGEAENLNIRLSKKDDLLNKFINENIEEVKPNEKIVKKLTIDIPKLYTYNNLHLFAEIIEEDGFDASNDLLIDINQELEIHIRDFVQKKMYEWERRGKYEKLDDYLQRVNNENRKAKINKFTSDALELIVKETFNEEFKNVQLEYDTESEIFKISMQSFPTLYLKAPISDAEDFERNFNLYEQRNSFFSLQNKEIVIAQTDFYNPKNSKTYHYDITEPVTFQSIDIQYSYKPVEFAIQSQIQPGAIDELKRTLELGVADVDVNIPEQTDQIVKISTYALIIGNENYLTYQTGLSKEVNVDYAVNDAAIFKEYLVKTIGVPEKNITFKTNATLGQMRQSIAKLAALSEIKEGVAELIFYYSGHGLPDETSHEAYIMQVDISGSDVSSAIKLNDVDTQLTEFPAERVTVFLDACFSGGARNQPLVAMLGIKIPPKENVLNGNMVVFSSSSGEESSGAYHQKQHGMFTYFLLKKLQETKGDVTYKELDDYIYNKVREESVLINDKLQTPQTSVSPVIQIEWEEWKLK